MENLSGGQRQAVAISRALRLNAELIVMDEPTAALGVKETAQVLDLIRRLKADGKTIILVSHNMADVVAVASRVAIFKNGRKVIDRATAGLDADALAHMVNDGELTDNWHSGPMIKRQATKYLPEATFTSPGVRSGAERARLGIRC